MIAIEIFCGGTGISLSLRVLSVFPYLSSVNLCSNPEDKLQIYRDNFEKAYLDSTERFYRTQAPSYLQQNGVQNYMKYVCIAWSKKLGFYGIFSLTGTSSGCLDSAHLFAFPLQKSDTWYHSLYCLYYLSRDSKRAKQIVIMLTFRTSPQQLSVLAQQDCWQSE